MSDQTYKLDKILQLAAQDKDFVLAIVAAFIEEIPQDLKVLQEAVKSKDFKLVRCIAHKMKPNLDLFEIEVLQDLNAVQDWGKANNLEASIGDALLKVSVGINNAIIALNQDFNL